MPNGDRESVVLDLKSPVGKQALRELAATADVLVENFAPGVMGRAGNWGRIPNGYCGNCRAPGE